MRLRHAVAAVLVVAWVAACAGDATRSPTAVEQPHAEAPVAPPPDDSAAAAPGPAPPAPAAAAPAPEPVKRTGSVVVHVVDRSGAPWRDSVSVSLFAESADVTVPLGSTVAINGTAAFPDVGAHRALSALV